MLPLFGDFLRAKLAWSQDIEQFAFRIKFPGIVANI